MSKEHDLADFILPKNIERFDLISKRLKSINSQLFKKKFKNSNEFKQNAVKDIFTYIFSLFTDEEYSIFLKILNFFLFKTFTICRNL